MIGGAKGIGIGIDFGIPNQYCRATSKPYIEKDVLDSLRVVASAYGKSNDDADRSIVKNLVDASNPFIISNAAFKLNSGFGKYSADFESFDWTVNISQKQHNKATISLNGRLCNHTAIEVDEMKINIIGNVTELIYWYIANPDDTTRSEIRLTSGINTLPKSYAKDDGQTYNIGFAYISGDSEITIEQIPSFEGAFVTGGIDDLITSTKTVQEMLGESNEITVVSMIHQVKDSANNVSFTNYIRGSANGYFRNIVNNYDKTGIYGYTSSDLMGLSVVNNILGDKNDYTSNGDNRDSIINGNFSVQGYSYNDGNNTGDFSSVAWYWTVIANKVLTTDQINQVIAYFNLDRTLKPDILCNTIKQGITNENHAEFGDKLIDYSGNGRDIQLNNIAWNKESGIDDDGALCLDGVNDFGKVTGMPIYKDYTVIADREIETINGGVLSKSYVADNGSFIFEQYHLEQDSTSSFGYTKLPIDNLNRDRKISYQSKYSYNGTSLSVGTGIDGSNMWLATIRDNDSRFSNIAIYSLMTFPYSMSEFLLERQLKRYKLGTLYPNMVEFRPIVKSNSEYSTIGYLNYSHNLATIKVGDYISIGDTVAIRVILGNAVDELVNCKVNGQECEIVNVSPKVFDCKFTITSKSPQKINITIDEYIRFEDIVQPYPVLLRFKDENGNEVSWGGKFKVGSTITRIGSIADPESNLLNGLYSISGLSLNGKGVTSSTSIVEKQMVFKTIATYLLDNNEPKCILSPRLLSIPNSSYKILGYIPDISGHGNNGVINNSAYAEGSGVNEDGSYQFDGVDDFVTIPTVTGGKQVLMKVNWRSDVGAVTLYDQRLNISDYEFAIYNGTRDLDDNPVMAYQGRNNGQTYIDGILNNNIMASELKAITHNITITNELSLGINNTYPVIGSTRSNTHFAQMSLYDFMLFDEISTDDKIKELNEYVGIEGDVWGILTKLSNSTLISNETLIKNE